MRICRKTITVNGIPQKVLIPHELGRKIAACRLWNRILGIDDSRMTRKLLMLDINNESSFSNSIKSICDECNMLPNFDNCTTLNIKQVTDCLLRNFEVNWKQGIESKPKLRTYKLYKESFQVENYCKLFIPKFPRSLLCQLRLGILPRQLEIGRYTGKPENERICPICTFGKVENEQHFLFDCPFYAEERLKSWRSCSYA